MTSPKISISLLLLLGFSIFIANSSIVTIVNDNGSVPENTESPPTDNPNFKKGIDMNYAEFKVAFGKPDKDDGIDREKEYKRNIEVLRNSDCHPCGVTKYFDWTEEQLSNLFGKIPGKGQDPVLPVDFARLLQTSNPPTLGVPPLTYDWRAQNVMTPVKNQGSCGSCWSFASVAYLESELIRRGIATKTVDLSEQYFLKCDTSSFGCSGGYINTALRLAIKTGAPTEATYPYLASTSYSTTMCKKPKITYKNFSTSTLYTYWNGVSRMSDATIINYLARGPVVTSVSASEWYMYTPSTSRTFSCSQGYSNSTNTLNHAVVIVGFTQTEWIVRNSWGASWGTEGGYIYINRDPLSSCGLGYEIDTFTYPPVTLAY